MTKKLMIAGVTCLIVGALVGGVMWKRQSAQAAWDDAGSGDYYQQRYQIQNNNGGNCPMANGDTCDSANCPAAKSGACPGRAGGGCPGAVNGTCPNQANGTCPGMAAGRGHHGR